MRPCRSLLFVPGNRPGWMEKAADYGADCLILDLEDSVPDREKIAARPLVRAGIKALKAKGQSVTVRVNGFATGLTLDDLEGVLCPELDGVFLPKIESAADTDELDALLTHLEKRMRIPARSISTPLLCETAKAMRNMYEIATSCPRVRGAGLAAGPGGDAARAIGYIWSKEGTETLFLRSKAVLDARAAGIRYPTISSWWNIKDLEGLERDARWNRQLGFRGMAVIHPSHVPVVNKVFTPSGDEIAFYQGLIQEMEEMEKKGIAAIAYKGEMVDEAMVKTAREMLEFAKSIGLQF
ncbi:MAG TPA: CoA ester lyase [Thermodesulfobacteriota bacterium]|nr:CoA ester lyase [Thermodesulfobacteriota bacterium]